MYMYIYVYMSTYIYIHINLGRKRKHASMRLGPFGTQTFKKSPKIDPGPFQNPPQISHRIVQNPFRIHPGSYLGPSWPPLGPSWR